MRALHGHNLSVRVLPGDSCFSNINAQRQCLRALHGHNLSVRVLPGEVFHSASVCESCTVRICPSACCQVKVAAVEGTHLACRGGVEVSSKPIIAVLVMGYAESPR